MYSNPKTLNIAIFEFIQLLVNCEFRSIYETFLMYKLFFANRKNSFLRSAFRAESG